MPLLARLATRLLPFLALLVLLLGSLDLLPSAGASSTRLPFFLSKIALTASSPEAQLMAMSNSSFESTGGLRSKLAH
jgi:hypothetical protein